jgi:hypothetical protein
MPEPKVLEPLQHQEESRPFPVRKPTEFRQVLSPAPTQSGRTHRPHPIRTDNPSQSEDVLLNTYRVSPSPIQRQSDSRNTGLPSLVSASRPSPRNPPRRSPDRRTVFLENPCSSVISDQVSSHQESVISLPEILLIAMFCKNNSKNS